MRKNNGDQFVVFGFVNTVHRNIVKAWQIPMMLMGFFHAFPVISRSLFATAKIKKEKYIFPTARNSIVLM